MRPLHISNYSFIFDEFHCHIHQRSFFRPLRHTDAHKLFFCTSSQHQSWSWNSMDMCFSVLLTINNWMMHGSMCELSNLQVHFFKVCEFLFMPSSSTIIRKLSRYVNMAWYVVCRLHATIANTTWHHSQFSIFFSVCTLHVKAKNWSSHSVFPNYIGNLIIIIITIIIIEQQTELNTTNNMIWLLSFWFYFSFFLFVEIRFVGRKIARHTNYCLLTEAK